MHIKQCSQKANALANAPGGGRGGGGGRSCCPLEDGSDDEGVLVQWPHDAAPPQPQQPAGIQMQALGQQQHSPQQDPALVNVRNVFCVRMFISSTCVLRAVGFPIIEREGYFERLRCARCACHLFVRNCFSSKGQDKGRRCFGEMCMKHALTLLQLAFYVGLKAHQLNTDLGHQEEGTQGSTQTSHQPTTICVYRYIHI